MQITNTASNPIIATSLISVQILHNFLQRMNTKTSSIDNSKKLIILTKINVCTPHEDIIIMTIIIKITNINNNNNNNVPKIRKYWVHVQQGIVSSHGDRDPL